MQAKEIRLSPKKGGHGHVTSYSVNIGSAEVRDVGFIDEDGNALPIEKVIDRENHQIVIRLKTEE